MTTIMFFTIFGVCAVATGLITEAIKKLIPDNSPNLIALIVALITGTGGTAVYYVFNQIPFSFPNVLAMILMGVAVAVGAMVGYDKVAQCIKQMFTK